jgi:hypothetical protein
VERVAGGKDRQLRLGLVTFMVRRDWIGNALLLLPLR